MPKMLRPPQSNQYADSNEPAIYYTFQLIFTDRLEVITLCEAQIILSIWIQPMNEIKF